MRHAMFGMLVMLAGCSINHRSGDFVCVQQSDCSANQTCTDGFCITNGTPSDGPKDAKPDAFVCPAQCTSCNAGGMECTVDCGLSAATCQAAINCPPGFNCKIICSRTNSCPTINCTAGASCDIDCKVAGTCKMVTCGPGPCTTKCTGSNSCASVNCSTSCACDVECIAGVSCLPIQALSCPGDPGMCNTFGVKGCDSDRDGCNTCP